MTQKTFTRTDIENMRTMMAQLSDASLGEMLGMAAAEIKLRDGINLEDVFDSLMSIVRRLWALGLTKR